jgi:tRNA threonylcarbamoyladenosine dehydratase
MNGPAFFSSEQDLPEGVIRIDLIPQAKEELFFIENPALRKGMPGAAEQLAEYLARDSESTWVVYPWLSRALRIPDEATYFKLRTARNRNLITDAEQAAYRKATVGIAGLSVGSAALSALVATGGPKKIKLADPDTIDITNLNRIQATLADVGQNKTHIAAQNAWELDPFLDLEIHPEGVTKESLPEFLGGLTVFIDEMDAIALKVEARMRAKDLKVPVVMATDNGDSAILDVERFDLEPERPIFHGRIEIKPEELADMTRDQFVRLANRIIDPKNFTPRQQDSLMQIGTHLSGVAQLYTAASVSGAAVALAVRRIASGQEMPSGRYIISLEEAIEPGYKDETQRAERHRGTERFIAHFG